MTITKASDLMVYENQMKMIALKAEYSKLTTTPKRMKEIYLEMTALREERVALENQIQIDSFRSAQRMMR